MLSTCLKLLYTVPPHDTNANTANSNRCLILGIATLFSLLVAFLSIVTAVMAVTATFTTLLATTLDRIETVYILLFKQINRTLMFLYSLVTERFGTLSPLVHLNDSKSTAGANCNKVCRDMLVC